jgi:hypothetical protein
MSERLKWSCLFSFAAFSYATAVPLRIDHTCRSLVEEYPPTHSLLLLSKDLQVFALHTLQNKLYFKKTAFSASIGWFVRTRSGCLQAPTGENPLKSRDIRETIALPSSRRS